MRKHTKAYIGTAICIAATTGLICGNAMRWQIALGVIATLLCLAIALDLHSQHRDREKLRGRG